MLRHTKIMKTDMISYTETRCAPNPAQRAHQPVPLEDELVSEGQDPKVKEQKQKDVDSKAKQCPTMPKCPQELEDIRKIGMKKVVFMREMQLDAGHESI